MTLSFPNPASFGAWTDLPAHWLRAHLPEIAVSLTAMCLVVAGPYLNAGLKNLSGRLHMLLRYGLFVLLSTVGYGLITHFGLRAIRGMLSGLGKWELICAVAGAHLALAWLLKRDKAI